MTFVSLILFKNRMLPGSLNSPILRMAIACLVCANTDLSPVWLLTAYLYCSSSGCNAILRVMSSSASLIAKPAREASHGVSKFVHTSSGSLARFLQAAKDCGLKAASEVFADRGYEEDGSLVNRRKEGAFIRDEDEAIARVIRMVKEGKVTAVTGQDIDIQADSVCVHGDGEKALLFVEKIRTALKAEGIEIAPLCEICR